MSGTVKFTNEDFSVAAVTFRKELLRLPIIGAQATLKYMTTRFGIRGEEGVGAADVDAEFAPYKPGVTSDANLNIAIRSLKTYFGSLNKDFEPNSAISTLLGHLASQANSEGGLANTITAREVLALIAKRASGKLNMAIWKAKRNAEGNTTMDLFDGFDTITEKEIEEGGISADVGNLISIDEEITIENAYDVAQLILSSMSDELREEHCYLYTTYNFYTKYCQAYKLVSGGIPYNQQYVQTFVEGSNNMLEIVPLASKKGSQFMHVSPKANMLFGCDQMSDKENVRVKEFKPDVLTFMMRMFAGCQFESIDPRRLLVAKLS